MENMDLEIPELNAGEWGWDYVLPPSGTWQAVIYSIIDLWTLKEEFQWVEKDVHKIRIWFEFSDDDDNVHSVFKEFALSFNNKSKLRKFVDWMNWGMTPMTNEQAKTFNVYTLLNKECSINLVIKKSAKWSEYADIDWLSQRIKKIALHERKNPVSWLHLSEKYFNEEVYKIQPQFVKDKIDSSPEAKKIFWVDEIEKANDEFEKELNKPTQWKTISEVEASTEKFRQQSQEISEDEAKQVFTSTEWMQ